MFCEPVEQADFWPGLLTPESSCLVKPGGRLVAILPFALDVTLLVMVADRRSQMTPEQLIAALRQAEAERDALRATVSRLNRRAQTAEAGVRANVAACKTAGVSLGRALANAAA
mgnify:CR=1 FL=1